MITSSLQNVASYDTISPMVRFLREVRGELEKVTFPSRQEVMRMTAIVITISLVVGLYLGALDSIFLTGLEFLIK